MQQLTPDNIKKGKRGAVMFFGIGSAMTTAAVWHLFGVAWVVLIVGVSLTIVGAWAYFTIRGAE